MKNVTPCSLVEMHWPFLMNPMPLSTYRAECNTAFMFCWMVEVTFSFQMFVNYRRVTRRHNTVDSNKILFTSMFLFIACKLEK